MLCQGYCVERDIRETHAPSMIYSMTRLDMLEMLLSEDGGYIMGYAVQYMRDAQLVFSCLCSLQMRPFIFRSLGRAELDGLTVYTMTVVVVSSSRRRRFED